MRGDTTDYRKNLLRCQVFPRRGDSIPGKYIDFITKIFEEYERMNISSIPLLAPKTGVK